MDSQSSNSKYPLKDIATIRWLEQRAVDLMYTHHLLHENDRTNIESLGYSPNKAAENFMDTLRQVLFHPDPKSLLTKLKVELDQLNMESMKLKPKNNSGIRHSIGAIISTSRQANRLSFPGDDLFREFERRDLELAVNFIGDALHILNAETLDEGESRIREMYANWYSRTGSSFSITIDFSAFVR